MNIADLTNNLKNPKEISPDHTEALENVLEEFPYFQAGHFLYLNCLKNQNSFKYNNYLKKTAAFTTDRTVLFNFICSDKSEFLFTNKNVSEFFEVENLDQETNRSIEFTETEKEQIESTELPIGTPFDFDFSDGHSFNEWLQISTFKPIEREIDSKIETVVTEPNNVSDSKKRESELIQKFIASNPKIKPTKSYEFEPLVFDGTVENESLMTETLAHVYLEQKKYQKAITAFTVLSLKYPKKSSFFANRIEEIKKLQEK